METFEESNILSRSIVASLPGKPDIVFPSARVIIFCDGDFWHGRRWASLSRKLRSGTNGVYWLSKIKANRARDRRTNHLLAMAGWTVYRVWESDIRLDVERVAGEIAELVQAKRGSL